MKFPAKRQFDDPAAGAAEFLMRLGIAVLMIAGPVGSVFSRRIMFTLVPVGAALMIASVLMAPRGGGFRPLQEALATPLGMAGLGLIAWAGASLLWTPFPSFAAERYLKMIGVFAAVAGAIAILPMHVRTPNLNLLPIGLGVAALCALGVVVVTSPQFALVAAPESDTLERASAGFAVLVWPALGALAIRERWISAGVLSVAVAAAIIVVGSPAAMGGLAAGAFACALGLAGTRRLAQAFALLFAAAFAGAPLLALAGAHLAALAGLAEAPYLRGLVAWAFLIQEEGWRTLTGFGFDAAVRGLRTGFIPPDAPQGAILQLWFDLGAIGGLLAAALVVRVTLAAGAVAPPASAFLLSSIVACLTIVAFSPLSLQLWWVTVICVVAIACAIMMKGQYRTTRPSAALVRDAPRTPAA
jgi:hypothetical protein